MFIESLQIWTMQCHTIGFLDTPPTPSSKLYKTIFDTSSNINVQNKYQCAKLNTYNYMKGLLGKTYDFLHSVAYVSAPFGGRGACGNNYLTFLS